MEHTFHVDLRGVVDLLSHHLYSSPAVYVRELLQNSVDAVTARRETDPDAPARIRVEPAHDGADGALRVHDTGIGLTEPEVHELLATIGGSAKRDGLGFSRGEFLGQFGIGLLSCFLVADEIEVVTRHAADPDAATVVWRGYSGGRYTVTTGPPREEPGTTVTLRPRPGCGFWMEPGKVRALARHYGELLPGDVRVGTDEVIGREPVWAVRYPDAEARREALLDYGELLLGRRPFDVVDLSVPEAGLSGVAFVPAAEAHPGETAHHRVYLKRMLLTDAAERLLPDWAFFARCVVDTAQLRPTANREQLYEDDLLDSTREALGQRLRDWLVDLSATSPERLRNFLSVHHRGVMSLALHDDDMLRIVDRWVELETTDGSMTLAGFRRRHREVLYSATTEEFRQISGIASAHGVGLVNGGYSYVIDVLERLPAIDPDVVVRRLDPAELATRFAPVGPEHDATVAAFLDAARGPLARLGCVPDVRVYDPASTPALLLESRSWHAHSEWVAASREATGAWADLLGTPEPPPVSDHPVLMFNQFNPLVRQLLSVRDPALVGLAVEALYGRTLLAGQHPLRPADTAALDRSFLGLVERAIRD